MLDEVEVKCPKCGKVSTIPDLNIVDNYVVDDTKPRGVETAYIAKGSIKCSCGKAKITVTYQGYSYPEGAPIEDWEFVEIEGGDLANQ